MLATMVQGSDSQESLPAGIALLDMASAAPKDTELGKKIQAMLCLFVHVACHFCTRSGEVGEDPGTVSQCADRAVRRLRQLQWRMCGPRTPLKSACMFTCAI